MSFKQRYQQSLHNVIIASSRFWFAITVFLLITLLFMWDLSHTNPNEVLYISLFLTASSGILMQLIFEKFAITKRFLQCIFLAVLLLINLSYYFYLQQTTLDNYLTGLRTGILFFIIWLGIIWLPSFKSTHATFALQLIIFLKSYFVAFLLSLVLFLGLSAIISAFSFLIHELSFSAYGRIAALTWSGFFPIYFLSLLPNFPNTKDQPTEKYLQASQIPKFLNILFIYILLPVLGIYTAILLIYFLKNISHFWQDSLIGPLLISYLIAGWLLLFLIETLSHPLVTSFKKYFPPVLMLITLLQTVATLTETYQFGLTDASYFQTLFLLFSFIATLIYWWRHQLIDWIPVLLIFLSFIAILPSINAISLSTNSQIKRLERTLEENHLLKNGQMTTMKPLDQQTKEQIATSYKYLNRVNALSSINFLPTTNLGTHDFTDIFGFNLYTLQDVTSTTPSESGQTSKGFTIETDEYELPQLDVQQADVWLKLRVMDGVFNMPGQSKTATLAFDFNHQTYKLKWTDINQNTSQGKTEPHLQLFEGDKELANYDLSFLRELSDDSSIYEHLIKSSSELTFKQSFKDVAFTLVITQLQVREDRPLTAEFYLMVQLP